MPAEQPKAEEAATTKKPRRSRKAAKPKDNKFWNL